MNSFWQGQSDKNVASRSAGKFYTQPWTLNRQEVVHQEKKHLKPSVLSFFCITQPNFKNLGS